MRIALSSGDLPVYRVKLAVMPFGVSLNVFKAGRPPHLSYYYRCLRLAAHAGAWSEMQISSRSLQALHLCSDILYTSN
jgi:hypothetical protein